MPEHFTIGGGPRETEVGPVSALLLLVSVVCILSLPRRHVIAPIVLAAMLIPMGNVLVVLGLHLPPTRIIALFGLLRAGLMGRSKRWKLPDLRLNAIDKAFVWNVVCHITAFVILWRSVGALINQFGLIWSELGVYFLLRYFIRSKQDVRFVVKLLLIVACVMAAEMCYEHVKGENLFGLMVGGVPTLSEVRDGKIRSQGAFGHSILAGTFGAVMLPLFIWLWQDKSKTCAVLGIAAAFVMVYTSGSSTPILGFVAGIVALGFWPIRAHMRMVRWGIVFGLIAIQLFMHAPLWFLIAHADVTGASSANHRAELVNLFITRFFDWWLIGTRDTGSWGWDMFDTSNAYVYQGESGGVLAFAFFLLVITRAFGSLGRERKSAATSRNHNHEWLLWCLCASLFANVVSFFGVFYWDQMEVSWFLLLAVISAVAISPQKREEVLDLHREKVRLWGPLSSTPSV